MVEINLEQFRKDCGSWDEEDGCLDDYPDECPLHGECEKEALGDEVLVPA